MGHSQASQKPLFLRYAGELGLDVEQFERTMDDPATKARVQRDVDDGLALGVSGTPTIYINGVATEPMPSYETLAALIDAALKQGQSRQGSGGHSDAASHHMDARRRWSLTA